MYSVGSPSRHLLVRLVSSFIPMSRITLLSSFQAHDSRAWYSSWSPDGNEILTCGADKSVKIWGRMGDSWVLKETLDGLHSKSIRSCEMSPDGK